MQGIFVGEVLGQRRDIVQFDILVEEFRSLVHSSIRAIAVIVVDTTTESEILQFMVCGRERKFVWA